MTMSDDAIADALDRATEALREVIHGLMGEQPRPGVAALYARSASFRELFIKLEGAAGLLAQSAQWLLEHDEDRGLFSDDGLHPTEHLGEAAHRIREAAAAVGAAYQHADKAQNAIGHVGGREE